MAEFILLNGAPLIFLAVFVIIFRAFFLALRQNGSSAKKGRTAAGKAAGPDANPLPREDTVSRSRETAPETSPVSEASSGYGSLGYGSLGGESPEGVDPCHDQDPAEWPNGSLGAETMEGEDPCHEERPPLPPAREAGPEELPGGLNLSWTGDEVVKGFVYGEVLRRKKLT